MIRGLQPKPDRTEGPTEVWGRVDFIIGHGQKNWPRVFMYQMQISQC